MIDQAKALRSRMSKSKDLDLGINEVATQERDIQIYAIASGKGGVGKTNFVVNMAISMQKLGKKVLIIDTDFGFANIDVICGLTPKYSLQDVLFHDVLLKDIVLEGPEGIKIIPGGGNALEISSLTQENQLLLQRQFVELDDVDVILVDTGAGISKLLILYVMFAKELIMVTTPEPTSLTDAYSFLKVIDKYRIKKSVRIVVNRVLDEAEAIRTFQLLESTTARFLEKVKLELLGYVRDDRCVSDSVKAQKPFVKKFPDSNPSKDIMSIARILCDCKDQKAKVKSIQDVFQRLVRVFT
ncbi:MAG TPA: MinD/ParA family protein [Firmicutes bacterium]|nr:MinD/ParA family protein [Bacillota bacterium]